MKHNDRVCQLWSTLGMRSAMRSASLLALFLCLSGSLSACKKTSSQEHNEQTTEEPPSPSPPSFFEELPEGSEKDELGKIHEM